MRTREIAFIVGLLRVKWMAFSFNTRLVTAYQQDTKLLTNKSSIAFLKAVGSMTVNLIKWSRIFKKLEKPTALSQFKLEKKLGCRLSPLIS